jgi:hypothetical protein
VFKRLQRSFDLVKASAALIADNKILLLFPALSALASGVVIATFALPVILAYSADPESLQDQQLNYVWMFLLYVVLYFVSIFFNTALVSVALARLDGRDSGFQDGFARAVQRLPAIAGYAVIAATVGVLLRAIEQRIGWVGRLVVGLIGAVWTIATFLVVPILAAQDVGPVQAVRDSATLLKKTWGENLAGNIGIALIFGVLYAMLVAAAMFAAITAVNAGLQGVAIAIGAAAVTAGIALAAGQATVQGVYAAAIYRYATRGEIATGFDRALFEGAFKGR